MLLILRKHDFSICSFLGRACQDLETASQLESAETNERVGGSYCVPLLAASDPIFTQLRLLL